VDFIVGFNVETVEYKNISFTVWDVGGQDRYGNFCYTVMRTLNIMVALGKLFNFYLFELLIP
jgi:GTPase SAR1 family protein